MKPERKRIIFADSFILTPDIDHFWQRTKGALGRKHEYKSSGLKAVHRLVAEDAGKNPNLV